MDRGLVHKSSPLVGEMGEGHGWWSVNNLRPPFEQHNPAASLFLPSTTTTTASSSPLHSFSSLLLSNHCPLPTTSTAPWHATSSSNQQGQQLQEPWSHLFTSSSGGLANGDQDERYKNWEGQALLQARTTDGEAADGSSAGYIYSHGSNPSGDEIQLAMSSPSPWAGGLHLHHNTQLHQSASSPRSSSITSNTSLGSNMLEFSNNGSPRECISTASGAAFKKARTQEPSPPQSTVKVRKEKLGDRITALHQLVSPFGKTDTASVLLEAIGYIRFLHGQIEGLSSPYQLGGSNGSGGCSKQQQHEASVQQGERNSIFPEDPGQLLHDKATRKRGHSDLQDGSSGEESKKDLRSRGLCLVPVSCTLDIGGADAGPADYWTAAPPFNMGFGLDR